MRSSDMFKPLVLANLMLLGSSLVASASGPFLRVAPSQTTGTNLLRNADFEQGSTTVVTSWSAAPQGYRLALTEGRGGSRAVSVESTNANNWYGASQSISLNRTSTAPIIVRGWSRAESVSGSVDNDYSLYVDIIYNDGTPLWGQTGNFSIGTHDWEERVVTIVPEKPVKTLSLYCLFRGQHTGRVWFDDLSVAEVIASGEAVVFQGIPMIIVPETNGPPPMTSEVETQDGLRLGLAGQRVVSIKVNGKDLGFSSPGGFFVRDVATNSDIYGFADGACPELGLALNASVIAKTNHLIIQGRLSSNPPRDRAVMLLFALPVDAVGWNWGDDVRRSRLINGKTEFMNVGAASAGATGSLSKYPLGVVCDSQTGLALAIDMGAPALYRMVYHPGTRQFFIAFDFGLVPETERFPAAADFRFVVYHFDPKWGFRAAFQKLTEIFPAYFNVSSRQQGIWMPFTDVSTVQGWQDFGFRYHEGNNNVPFDVANDILSFRYTEPMTWWMSMPVGAPRTEAEAITERDAYAAGPAGQNKSMATAAIAAGMQDAAGHSQIQFINAPWNNGAVWSLNPNPNLPAPTNGATVHWNPTIKNQLYGPGIGAMQAGEYLDSLEGYVTAELNFRREHFRYSTVPLTFSSETRQPALFKGLAIYEFTRWISDDVRGLGKLMFANGVPYRFGFLCPWLDVMGTETDWMSGGQFQPVADPQLCLWRTLAGAKPYLLLMNTDFSQFTSAHVEKYFQRCLGYGFLPSMFSQDASSNPYWQNPALYNRDRALFQKYIPLIRRVAEAGWSPVSRALCTPDHIIMERFGSLTNGTIYLTLYNTNATSAVGKLQLEPGLVGDPAKAIAIELLSTNRLPFASGGWTFTLAGESVAVVRIEPGPRFTRIHSDSPGLVRVNIEGPADLESILERSNNLFTWLPIRTNLPQPGPVAIEESIPSTDPAAFYRLRW